MLIFRKKIPFFLVNIFNHFFYKHAGRYTEIQTFDIIYDLLPNVTNRKLWRYTDSDQCLSCKSDRGTLRHILSARPQSLQIYTWRHNKVLQVVIELLRAQYETANLQPVTAKEPIIQFLKEGEYPVRKQNIPI